MLFLTQLAQIPCVFDAERARELAVLMDSVVLKALTPHGSQKERNDKWHEPQCKTSNSHRHNKGQALGSRCQDAVLDHVFLSFSFFSMSYIATKKLPRSIALTNPAISSSVNPRHGFL
jgi:hypothetical protein